MYTHVPSKIEVSEGDVIQVREIGLSEEEQDGLEYTVCFCIEQVAPAGKSLVLAAVDYDGKPVGGILSLTDDRIKIVKV